MSQLKILVKNAFIVEISKFLRCENLYGYSSLLLLRPDLFSSPELFFVLMVSRRPAEGSVYPQRLSECQTHLSQRYLRKVNFSAFSIFGIICCIFGSTDRGSSPLEGSSGVSPSELIEFYRFLDRSEAGSRLYRCRFLQRQAYFAGYSSSTRLCYSITDFANFHRLNQVLHFKNKSAQFRHIFCEETYFENFV